MDIAKSTRVGLAKFDKKQAWLVGILGVSKQHVSNICCGRSLVSLKRIEILATAFGVSVSEFIKWGE